MENDSAAAGYSAHAALQDAAAARDRSAARVVTPWWYHPILGAAVALLPLGFALSWGIGVIFWAAASVLISLSLSFVYRHITGIWVGPAQTGPRSRPVWIAYAIILAIIIGATLAIGTDGQTWLLVLLASTAFLATVIFGRWVDAALRADIRAGDATLEAR